MEQSCLGQQVNAFSQELILAALQATGLERDQQPEGMGRHRGVAPQMVVEQATQAVATHRQLAHLAADDDAATPGTGGVWGTGRQKGSVGRQDSQEEGRALEAAPLAVKTIKDPSALEPVLLRQGHRASRSASDRQAGPAPAAAGADHAPARMGAHPHPETGHALALAARSFQCALRHAAF